MWRVTRGVSHALRNGSSGPLSVQPHRKDARIGCMVSPGRPRLITTDRIIEAGKRITLPHLSIRGVAKELGVSEMSIYRIVGDLEGLRAMVAEGIVAGHVFPEPTATDPEDALVELAHTLRAFVMANPGIGQHLAKLAAPGMISRSGWRRYSRRPSHHVSATRRRKPVCWSRRLRRTRSPWPRSIRCPTMTRPGTLPCPQTPRRFAQGRSQSRRWALENVSNGPSGPQREERFLCWARSTSLRAGEPNTY